MIDSTQFSKQLFAIGSRATKIQRWSVRLIVVGMVCLGVSMVILGASSGSAGERPVRERVLDRVELHPSILNRIRSPIDAGAFADAVARADYDEVNRIGAEHLPAVMRAYLLPQVALVQAHRAGRELTTDERKVLEESVSFFTNHRSIIGTHAPVFTPAWITADGFYAMELAAFGKPISARSKQHENPGSSPWGPVTKIARFALPASLGALILGILLLLISKLMLSRVARLESLMKPPFERRPAQFSEGTRR